MPWHILTCHAANITCHGVSIACHVSNDLPGLLFLWATPSNNSNTFAQLTFVLGHHNGTTCNPPHFALRPCITNNNYSTYLRTVMNSPRGDSTRIKNVLSNAPTNTDIVSLVRRLAQTFIEPSSLQCSNSSCHNLRSRLPCRKPKPQTHGWNIAYRKHKRGCFTKHVKPALNAPYTL